MWAMVGDSQVEKAVIESWDGKQILLQVAGELIAVKKLKDMDLESIRDRLVVSGVPVSYPAAESQNETLSSEGAVVGGLFTAVAVGVADSFLEMGVATVALTGAEIEGQSLLESKSAGEVIAEDVRFLEGAAQRAEMAAEADFVAAEQMASQLAKDEQVSLGSAAAATSQWVQDAWHGLFANHAPGIGGLVEDSFMGFLTLVSLFSLWEMAFLKRKSNSLSGLAHTATGAMQIGTVLYAIIEERCLRESPGAIWAVFTWLIFMVNNITMWPLLKYFKGPEVQRVLFKLAFSFIISFQGIHAIAWSAQYEWLYWLVMPFWFYSVKKLAESADNVLALMPDVLPGEIQENARRRVQGIQNDTPTIVYSALNFAGAVFDNLYMAVYTWRGPAGFWGWSEANIPGINDHLRTGLVKPAFGSLTISVLVFMGTLVYRKRLSINAALALNVVLASVGPWLILYYHKLVDWDEPWQPEIMGDWGSTPYFVSHIADLAALLALPLAALGAKAALAPAAPEVAGAPPIGLPDGLPPA